MLKPAHTAFPRPAWFHASLNHPFLHQHSYLHLHSSSSLLLATGPRSPPTSHQALLPFPRPPPPLSPLPHRALNSSRSRPSRERRAARHNHHFRSMRETFGSFNGTFLTGGCAKDTGGRPLGPSKGPLRISRAATGVCARALSSVCPPPPLGPPTTATSGIEEDKEETDFRIIDRKERGSWNGCACRGCRGEKRPGIGL